MKEIKDLDTMLSRAKRAEILKHENEHLQAEVERLQAECQAYRQLVDRFQEDATNKRALEQAKRRLEGKGAPMKW